ncbi:MAG: ribokinase [Gammaproteobacteria bacterium]|nr:ribokinase [Gammaproteobacteria bacterium]
MTSNQTHEVIDVITIGGANMDMVVEVPHLPAAGETIQGGQFHQFCGGKGANQAVAAHKNSATTALIAAIGKDNMGQRMLQQWQESGINSSAVVQLQEHNSGVAMIYVDRDGENCIAVAPGANMAFMPEHIDHYHHWFDQAKVVLLSLEIPLATVNYVAELASHSGCQVILDPAPAPAQPLTKTLYQYLTMMTPNTIEAGELSGITINDQQSAMDACQILHDNGANMLLLTMSEQGVLLSTAQQPPEWLPAFPVTVVDSTAAGDTFNGALAAALAQGNPLKQAIRFAQAAAALSVTTLGAQASIPCYQEVINFLQQYQS